MGFFIKLLVCALCVHFVVGENADILVLTAPTVSKHGRFADIENYDEVIKLISSAAKKARIYVVAHLYEMVHCQGADEVVRNNLVFNREGSIVALYRKTINKTANCTMSAHIPSFSTDFGVPFGLLMEEDLVLRKPEEFKFKNFVVSGGVKTEIPFLRGPQLATSWSFITNSNLITPWGVYISGRAGLKTSTAQIAVVELRKEGGEDSKIMTTTPAPMNLPSEDLSQYIIRPLDVEASIRGYTETVCNHKFCCEFYVKTSYVGPPHHEANYGLAAFDGVRRYTDTHHIGVQSCAIVACGGSYKRSCTLGPNNSTNTLFERIQIRGNFTQKDSAQFPVVLTTSGSQDIDFENEHQGYSNKVTTSITRAKDILSFGIFGRVYSKDFEDKTAYVPNEKITENDYNYFFNENVMEFFDYFWIRLRVLIFIVSIYVLEMM